MTACGDGDPASAVSIPTPHRIQAPRGSFIAAWSALQSVRNPGGFRYEISETGQNETVDVFLKGRCGFANGRQRPAPLVAPNGSKAMP